MFGSVQTSRTTGKASAADRYFAERYPGYVLKDFGCDKDGVFQFVLEPEHDGVQCPRCGRYCTRFHEARTVEVFDMDLFAGGPVKVVILVHRVRCRCGCHRTEPLPDWILPGHRVTKRLAAFVQKALLKLRISNTDIAALTGLAWQLIKDIDKQALKPLFDKPDIGQCVHLAIDEISIHKNHRYATVFMDLVNRQTMFVVQGKRQVDLVATFKKIQEQCPHLRSVSVDMNAGFPKLVSKYLPQCKLAYDRFHVVANFNRDVLVEARKTELARARKAYLHVPRRQRSDEDVRRLNEQLQILRSAEWLVLRDESVLKADKLEQLNRLRENNALFRDLYPLAAQLRAVWTADNETQARELLNDTIQICKAIAQEHDFKPIERFAKMLERRAEGIVNACVVGYGTNILEGANNTAKVIKRVGYGYQDFEYFALKLKAAFPGRRFKREHAGRYTPFTLYWQGSVETLNLPQKN